MPEKDETLYNWINTNTYCSGGIPANVYWTNTNTSTTAVPATISWSTPPPITFLSTSTAKPITEEDAKKYEETIDRHIEELEEDLHFFNEKREEHEISIELLKHTIAEQNYKIDELKTEMANLKSTLDFAISKITELEDKIYREMS